MNINRDDNYPYDNRFQSSCNNTYNEYPEYSMSQYENEQLHGEHMTENVPGISNPEYGKLAMSTPTRVPIYNSTSESTERLITPLADEYSNYSCRNPLMNK